MYFLGVNDDGNTVVLGENELFLLWLHFYDMTARNLVEVVEDDAEEE